MKQYSLCLLYTSTKEFSKSELERYLDEKDEKSAAYEKLVEQKKAEALADGTVRLIQTNIHAFPYKAPPITCPTAFV